MLRVVIMVKPVCIPTTQKQNRNPILPSLRNFYSKVCWESSYLSYLDCEGAIIIDFLYMNRTITENCYWTLLTTQREKLKILWKESVESCPNVLCFCKKMLLYRNRIETICDLGFVRLSCLSYTKRKF